MPSPAVGAGRWGWGVVWRSPGREPVEARQSAAAPEEWMYELQQREQRDRRTYGGRLLQEVFLLARARGPAGRTGRVAPTPARRPWGSPRAPGSPGPPVLQTPRH